MNRVNYNYGVLLVLFFCTAMMMTLQFVGLEKMRRLEVDVQKQVLSTSIYSTSHRLLRETNDLVNHNNVINGMFGSDRHCPSVAEYFDHDQLQAKIKENVDFHNRGGNLKALQNFLDNAMDPTLDKLGLKFVPTGSTEGERRASRYLRRHYEKHPSARQGYGESLPGKWSDEDSKVLHEKRWFDVIEPRKKHDKWDAGLGPIGPECKSLVQLGDTNGDGYKFIGMPPSKSEETCQVISVGGNDNWKFEEAVHRELGCETFTFDCTLPGGVPKNKPDNDKIHFFNYCIDGHSHKDSFGRSFLTYDEMLKKAGIEKPPSYFKIDVEGFEYDIFSQMIQTPELLPLQIQVELHWATRMTGLSWMERTRSAGEISLLSGMMFNAGGYLPTKLDFNTHCTSCMEVLYVRAACNANRS